MDRFKPSCHHFFMASGLLNMSDLIFASDAKRGQKSYFRYIVNIYKQVTSLAIEDRRVWTSITEEVHRVPVNQPANAAAAERFQQKVKL